jgi:hypothetical protein
MILWPIDPLLIGDCKQQPLLWSARSLVWAVPSHNNRRDDAGGVFHRSGLRLYDSTVRVLLSE